ncbi:MAG: hypothetical protein ABW352_18460 [Polyangiales bacterium]
MICLVGAMALVACGDDEAELFDGNLDGSLPDSSIDAARPDAGDATVQDSGSLPDCSPLREAYKLYQEGGLSPLRDVYTVSGAGVVKLDRLPGGAYMDAGTFSCTGSLGQCGTVDLDITDFTQLFPSLDTYWSDGSTVYGDDWRPMDGQATVIERADGKKIVIGNPCNGKAGCTAIPQGVALAKSLFDRLRTDISLGERADGGLAGSCGQ